MGTTLLFMLPNSNTELYFSLKGKCKETYRIGDSVTPRKIEQSIWDGEEIGRQL